MLTREDILSKTQLKRVKVHIPEWGGDVFVSEMSGAMRDKFEQDLLSIREKGQNIDNSRARLIVLTVVDEKGNPLFSDQDIAAIGKLSSVALDKAVDEAQKLNGLTESDIKKAEKNSKAAPSGDSTSD